MISMTRKTLVLASLCVVTLHAAAQGQASGTDDLNAFFKPVKWRSIGPFRGGRSVAGTGVVGDPRTYYMGTTGGGLWKTTDMGISWKNISDGFFKTGSVGAIAVAESDPNVVYVGMGEHAVRGVMTHHGDGVYRSTDAGKTWKEDRARADAAHLAGDCPPEEPGHRLRRRAGRPLQLVPTARCVQVRRWRSDVEERAVRERSDRRIGVVDGRHQSSDHVRRHVGTRTVAVEGHQRWTRKRPLQVHRQPARPGSE